MIWAMSSYRTALFQRVVFAQRAQISLSGSQLESGKVMQMFPVG